MANKVHNIHFKSFEADKTVTPDFNCYQVISPDFRLLTTYTGTALVTKSVLKSAFNTDGKLVSVKDSSVDGSNYTEYTYNSKGDLIRSEQHISGKGALEKQETHVWFYTDAGQPAYMLKLTNGKDTVKTSFTLDEHKRVAVEKTVFSNYKAAITYYYYNDQGQLTDIVKFSTKANRLLPEQMFEYTPEGNVAKNVQISSEGSSYITWSYTYNEAGLKIRETATDKYKQLLGWVELSY